MAILNATMKSGKWDEAMVQQLIRPIDALGAPQFVHIYKYMHPERKYIWMIAVETATELSSYRQPTRNFRAYTGMPLPPSIFPPTLIAELKRALTNLGANITLGMPCNHPAILEAERRTGGG